MTAQTDMLSGDHWKMSAVTSKPHLIAMQRKEKIKWDQEKTPEELSPLGMTLKAKQ